MKHISIIRFVFISTTFYAQDCFIPTNELGNFEVSKVVEQGNYSKEEITKAALLSVAEFVNDPNNITKFRDDEIGIFISEIEANVRTTIGGGNFFYFNLKMEIKDGKYRLTANYLDCVLVISTDTSCKCSNDLAAESCDALGCIILPKRWNILKCRAIEELRYMMEDYMKTIEANLANSDW